MTKKINPSNTRKLPMCSKDDPIYNGSTYVIFVSRSRRCGFDSDTDTDSEDHGEDRHSVTWQDVLDEIQRRILVGMRNQD